MTLTEIAQMAVPACTQFRVKRLDLFGSFARGTEKSESDIDLLVEFEEPNLQPAKRYFGLLHYLEDVSGLEIDLMTTNSLRNPFFRDRVLSERVNIYGE